MTVQASLQPALPRHMYVGAAHWVVERDRVLHASWFCVGRLDELGLGSSSRLVVVDVAGEFDPNDAGDFWDLVNRQDWAVCESVQRGMSSRAYREGWFAPMEDLAADIRRWLLPRLEDRLEEQES